jgi:signal transduction histidine kinase
MSRPARSRDPMDRLIAAARLRLAAVTLALVAILLLVVGAVTAAVAIGTQEATIDRSLRDSASAAMTRLAPEAESPGQTPSPSEEATLEPGEDASSEPGEGNAGDAAPGGDEGEDGSQAPPTAASTAGPTPVPTPLPTPSPAVSPAPSPGAIPLGTETDELPPASSDTFFLVLDAGGGVTANPGRVALRDLPDAAAVAGARANGEDLRTIDVGGVKIRLLTQPIPAGAAPAGGYLQSGFVLTLQDEQTMLLLRTILGMSLIGLLGAAVITLIVTRRALGPIRSAFSMERRFVAAASHELRTPVAVIRASAEILQREEQVAPGGRSLVEDIVAEADRLDRLVGDLLTLATAEAGAMTVRPVRVELPSLVAELARRAESMAGARGVKLGLDAPLATGDPARAGPFTQTDPERLAQLLLILVDNAVNHSPPGGTVRISLRDVRQARGPVAEISVADQGPGVPVSERQRIFEPFARLSDESGHPSSAGLGLAVARLLAMRLGAAIGVRDAPGGGALFSVQLRLSERPPTPSASGS